MPEPAQDGWNAETDARDWVIEGKTGRIDGRIADAMFSVTGLSVRNRVWDLQTLATWADRLAQNVSWRVPTQPLATGMQRGSLLFPAGNAKSWLVWQ